MNSLKATVPLMRTVTCQICGMVYFDGSGHTCSQQVTELRQRLADLEARLAAAEKNATYWEAQFRSSSDQFIAAVDELKKADDKLAAAKKAESRLEMATAKPFTYPRLSAHLSGYQIRLDGYRRLTPNGVVEWGHADSYFPTADAAFAALEQWQAREGGAG